MTRQIEDLARISAMLRDRDLGAVERIVSQLTAIQADVARLEEARLARVSESAMDVARLTGMDMQWAAEIERRMTQLRQREAGLRAQHEVALTKARKSFGRADVTARLTGIKPTV